MNENTAAIGALKIVGQYEEAIFTESETIGRLVSLSAKHSPEDFINSLPVRFIEELRKDSADPAPDPEDISLVRSICSTASRAQLRKQDRESRMEFYLGITALHNYFHPLVPVRNFEPRLFIGEVTEIDQIDNYTVIIGEFDSYFIRQHLIELINPNGQSITTRVARRSAIGDWRNFKTGLFLRRNIKSKDVEIGAKIWVLREKTII